MPCAATTPAPAAKSVRVVRANGKSRLEMKAEDGSRASCVRLDLESPAAGPVRLAAGKKQVRLTGNRWRARADQVEMTAAGQVVLSGDVCLSADKDGLTAVLKGKRLVLVVQDGCIKDVMGGIFE
jgi:hypothetical protein